MAIDLTVIKNSIKRNSCIIQYQTDEPGISYSWNWSPSATNVTTGSSGEAIITGLIPGALNTVLTTLTVTVATETGSTTLPPINGSISFYTQPAKWEWEKNGLKTNDFIYKYLNVDNWNNNFLPQFKKFLDWKQQDNSDISDYKVNKNFFIGAELYNRIAEACGMLTRVQGKTDTHPGDLISATVFNELAKGVSGEYYEIN